MRHNYTEVIYINGKGKKKLRFYNIYNKSEDSEDMCSMSVFEYCRACSVIRSLMKCNKDKTIKKLLFFSSAFKMQKSRRSPGLMVSDHCHKYVRIIWNKVPEQ